MMIIIIIIIINNNNVFLSKVFLPNSKNWKAITWCQIPNNIHL